MTASRNYPDHDDVYEYHGATTVVLTRRSGQHVIQREWLLFDSVEDAQDFFYHRII